MRLVTAAGLCALALALAACGGDDGDTVTGAGLPSGVPEDITAAPRDLGGSERSRAVRLPPRRRVFGMHGFLFLRDAPDPVTRLGITGDGQLRDQLAIGATSTRIQIGWWTLEPRPGRIDNAYVERVRRYTDALRAAGGRALVVLGVPPPWASQKTGDPTAAPKDDDATLQAYARYAATVARLFPDALAIETWNEPNTTWFWEPGRPDPEHMARLHIAAARAIRAAVPAMKVLTPGLLAVHRDHPHVMRPQVYLKRMYAAGLRPSDYDGLAIHPYPDQRGGRVAPLDRGVFAAQWQDFRLGYVWRDPRAAIWVTETGVTTTGPAAVSEAEQARALVAITRKLLSAPRVEAVYLHTNYDGLNLPESDRERGFGIARPAGGGRSTPKPAMCALRRLARRPGPLAGCP